MIRHEETKNEPNDLPLKSDSTLIRTDDTKDYSNMLTRKHSKHMIYSRELPENSVLVKPGSFVENKNYLPRAYLTQQERDQLVDEKVRDTFDYSHVMNENKKSLYQNIANIKYEEEPEQPPYNDVPEEKEWLPKLPSLAALKR